MIPLVAAPSQFAINGTAMVCAHPKYPERARSSFRAGARSDLERPKQACARLMNKHADMRISP